MSNPQSDNIDHLRSLGEIEYSLKLDPDGFPPEVRDANEYGKFLNWATQAAKSELDGYFHWQLANLYIAMQNKRDLYVRQQEEEAGSAAPESTELSLPHTSEEPEPGVDEIEQLLAQYQEAMEETPHAGVPSFIQDEQEYNKFLRIVKMAEGVSLPRFSNPYQIHLIELQAENLRNLFLGEQESSTVATATSNKASTGETDGSQRTVE